jgi:delta 1-pyrroline-5-carboxylate dehydrogenase
VRASETGVRASETGVRASETGVRASETGVKASEGISPTFLFDAPVEADICREACFAPVAAVIPFDSVDEAISLTKQCPFGLGASIFTSNATAAHKLAASIPSGSVTVNDLVAPTAHPATPFGGRGSSGWGVTQGEEGLLEMTVPQVVTVQSGALHLHFDEAVNPNPNTGDILRGLLRLTHARGIREKIRGVWQMVSGASRRQKDAKPRSESGTERTGK